jgi:hypothetical protein
MHEGVHTSLDAKYLHSEKYQKAMRMDPRFVSPYAE